MFAWIKSLLCKKSIYSVTVVIFSQSWCPVLSMIEYVVTTSSGKRLEMRYCRGDTRDIWVTRRELPKIVREIGAQYNTKPHVIIRELKRPRPLKVPKLPEYTVAKRIDLIAMKGNTSLAGIPET